MLIYLPADPFNIFLRNAFTPQNVRDKSSGGAMEYPVDERAGGRVFCFVGL